MLWLTDSGSSSTEDQPKSSDDLRKDASELGIEVIEHISTVAGNWWWFSFIGGCCVWQTLTVACYRNDKALQWKSINFWNVNCVSLCVNSAGLKAKEKRDKEKSSSTLRPPTRRGAHSTEQPVPTPSSHVASSCLCHPQLPSQCFVWCISVNDEIKSCAKTKPCACSRSCRICLICLLAGWHKVLMH